MKRGVWVALLGPDGVGKSTVIRRLEELLRTAFSGYRRGHFRPHFGRETTCDAVTAPHAQSPRGTIISVCKLAYWLADCWFGYLVFIAPGLQRNRLIVFDRYLPDVLVDPTRYRLPASVMKLAGRLVALAPQPDLYVLLDAPAKIVWRRKRELSLPELRRQREAYRQLLATLPGAIVADATLRVEDVALQVADAIQHLSTHPSSNAASLSPSSCA